jgi:asparagine synthase (glutamine-hydrolysing)
MSGIAGIVNLDGAPIDRDLLSRMTRFMSFRGPDAQEMWTEGNAGFCHTLLRTTHDATSEKQPLTLDGDVWLVADQRLDGQSRISATNDAELILRAYETWGENCVNHLLGDFAFAIWDKRSRRLFCARDHLGVRPFFFARAGNSFIFSNTLNALRLDPRVTDELNEIAVADYLTFGLNQDLATTIFRDIQRLPAAHTLSLSNGSITTRCYWAPSVKHETRFRDDQSYVDRFNELLTTATKDRLRTDRVSISMSGGLDSTSLAVIARDLLPQTDGPAVVRAYSTVYDRLIPDQERHYSSLAASSIGIPVSHLNADAYSLFEERRAGDLDQPEPFLLSPLAGQFNDLLRLMAANSRVALTGYDGDALMNEASQSRLRGFLAGIRGIKEKPISYPQWIDDAFARRTGLSERLRKFSSAVPVVDRRRPATIRALQSKLWTPLFEGYDAGATRLLLEVRHPFIDVRLVDYLLSIPANPWCVNKHILRRAMKDRLPEAVVNRPKTPLAGDPALQLSRHASVRLLDSFEVSPQLTRFVNVSLRRSLAEEETPDALWANLRLLGLNHWLAHSLPLDRRKVA